MENNDEAGQSSENPFQLYTLPTMGLNLTFPNWNPRYPSNDELLTNRQQQQRINFFSHQGGTLNALFVPQLLQEQMPEEQLIVDLSFQNQNGFNEQNHLDLLRQTSFQNLRAQLPQQAENIPAFRPILNNNNRGTQTQAQNERYYVLSERVRPIDTFDPTRPHLQITVTKSSANLALGQSQVYTVTEQGCLRSEKNTEVEDILIGRCQSLEIQGKKVIPNDIVLPQNDKAISRVHCKIITKHAFDSEVFTPEFIAYCQLWKIPNWSRLPKHIFQLIWQYAKRPKLFYLQDIGSAYGTYVKIHNTQPQNMERLQTYFVGADNIFNILECQSEENRTENHVNISKKQKGFHNCKACTNEYGSLEDQHTRFKHTRANIIYKYTQFVKVGFLDTQSNCSQDSQDTQREFDTNNLLSRPYLLVEFRTQYLNEDQSNQQVHLFFATQERMIFKVGRGIEENHVRIAHNTISRKQCRLWYCARAKKWQICDGDSERESSNGTWLSLQNCAKRESREQRTESELWPLQNGSEIKISEQILKIEMFNMYKKQNFCSMRRENTRKRITLSDILKFV